MQKKTAIDVKLWNRIPRAIKTAFICCFTAGFFVHIFAFTNIIPNPDGLSRVADDQQLTLLGRWFLHYATELNGSVQMPAVIGFLSLLFMSLAAALCVSILDIKNAVIGGLCGIIMIVFPSAAYTYLYMFTASAYFFGILLAVLAVWVAKRYKYGFLFAAVPLACGIGAYQAYFAVAAALSLLAVIIKALDAKTKAKEVILYGLKYIAFLVIGLLLYFIVLKIFLMVKDLEMSPYKGGDNIIASLSIGAFVDVYKQFAGYFFVGGKYCAYADGYLIALNAISVIIAATAFVIMTVKRKLYKTPGKLAIIIVLFALVPMACNLTSVVGDNTPLTRYGLVFAYVAVLALSDHATADIEPKKFTIRSVSCLTAMLIIWSSFITDNMTYTVVAQAHRSTEAFASNLVSRVESLEGYEQGMEVVIIGAFPTNAYYCDIEAFKEVMHYSCLPHSVLTLNKHVYYYLNDWINVPWEEPEEKLMIEIAASDEFIEMPLYPSDGSVMISDGRVIVKLAEQYKPKADYEIAYENRR